MILDIHLLKELIRIISFLCLGVVLGHLIEEMGWIRRLAFMAAPLMRFGHLQSECTVSFLTAFVSGTAANGMLASFYEQKKIEKKELFIAVMANSFPAYSAHLPTTLGIIVPLLAMGGFIYMGIQFLSQVVQTAIILIVGNFLLEKKSFIAQKLNPEDIKLKEAFKRALKKSKRTLKRVFIITIPVFAFISVLSKMGFFKLLRGYLSNYIPTSFLPPEAIGIITAQIVNLTSGSVVASGFLSRGDLSTKEVILALLIGNIIAIPFRTLRHSLPSYLGIFGPFLGTQLILASQALRVIVSLVVILVIYLFWIG
jgi:hypothetical protein